MAQWQETGLKNFLSDWHIPNYLNRFEVTFRPFRSLNAWRIPYYLKQLIAHWLFQAQLSSMAPIHKNHLPQDDAPTTLPLFRRQKLIHNFGYVVNKENFRAARSC